MHAFCCRDIDIAYMVLPVLVFLYYILDSAVVVAYLDTVYFGVVEWQQRILKWVFTLLLTVWGLHPHLCVLS